MLNSDMKSQRIHLAYPGNVYDLADKIRDVTSAANKEAIAAKIWRVFAPPGPISMSSFTVQDDIWHQNFIHDIASLSGRLSRVQRVA